MQDATLWPTREGATVLALTTLLYGAAPRIFNAHIPFFGRVKQFYRLPDHSNTTPERSQGVKDKHIVH